MAALYLKTVLATTKIVLEILKAENAAAFLGEIHQRWPESPETPPANDAFEGEWKQTWFYEAG